MSWTLSPEELESRLTAQRKVLVLLLEREITTDEDFKALKTDLEGDLGPLDQQEDPGAVPTQAHGVVMATQLELRSLLEPLELRFNNAQTK